MRCFCYVNLDVLDSKSFSIFLGFLQDLRQQLCEMQKWSQKMRVREPGWTARIPSKIDYILHEIRICKYGVFHYSAIILLWRIQDKYKYL